MQITVITVVYNGVATIEDTIQSVLDQDYSEIEYIIVDGASTDGTLDVIERYRGRVARVISEPDKGIYDAMNKGIAAAQGDVIGFLNSDDVYADNHVVSDIASCLRDGSVDACYGDLVYVDAKRTDRVLRYWKSCQYRPGLFLDGWMPAHPTFYARRTVYEKYGSFDLDYTLQSDFEITLRFIHVHRIRCAYIPRILVRMRMGGATNRSIRNVIRGNLEAYRACKKHGLRVSWLFMIRKVMSRLSQFVAKPDPAR